MNNKLLKLLIIILSVLFALRVATIFAADRLYSLSLITDRSLVTPAMAVGFLDTAIKLDPGNADLYYQKCVVLKSVGEPKRDIYKKQLTLLRNCVNLCPAWPAYHLHYAITLNRLTNVPNMLTKNVIVTELEKASLLDRMNTVNRAIRDKYSEKY